MKHALRLLVCFLVLAASALAPCAAQYLLSPDSQTQPNVPQGKMFGFDYAATPKFYPGSQSHITVYVPAQYDATKPACLCVGLDGPNFRPQAVFDNLIAKKQIPVTIGVFVSSGTVNRPGTNDPTRFDRCVEFDSVNDKFARFLTEEILPTVEEKKTPDGKAILLSADPNDRMIYGGSSGGVCAFTAAWDRPDLFRRVFTAIGTYVGMRGADQYPTLVRKTEPKPIRIFLQDGAQDTWNPLFDNWYTQNRSMEESLRFAGYDVNHNWGTLGHEGSHAESLFPDVVKWLWRDYPQPIVAGHSGNSMLQSVLNPAEGWRLIPTVTSPAHLTADASGNVYFTDGKVIGKIGSGTPLPLRSFFAPGTPPETGGEGVARGKASKPLSPPVSGGVGSRKASRGGFFSGSPLFTALACGPKGRLCAATSDGKILAYGTPGKAPVILADNFHARALFASSDGTLYAAELGKLWRLAPGGAKTLVDTLAHPTTGLTLSPDHALLFAAQGDTHWVYTYVVQPDGSLGDKQRFYWLHNAESADDDSDGSGATDLAEDTGGNLYAATRMGVQICDRNGRVEGILTLPDGPVISLCFGGPSFDTLYAVSGGKLYARRLNARGLPGGATPVPLPPFGGG